MFHRWSGRQRADGRSRAGQSLPGAIRRCGSRRNGVASPQNVRDQLSIRPMSPGPLSLTRSFQTPFSGSLDRLTV